MSFLQLSTCSRSALRSEETALALSCAFRFVAAYGPEGFTCKHVRGVEFTLKLRVVVIASGLMCLLVDVNTDTMQVLPKPSGRQGGWCSVLISGCDVDQFLNHRRRYIAVGVSNSSPLPYLPRHPGHRQPQRLAASPEAGHEQGP